MSKLVFWQVDELDFAVSARWGRMFNTKREAQLYSDRLCAKILRDGGDVPHGVTVCYNGERAAFLRNTNGWGYGSITKREIEYGGGTFGLACAMRAFLWPGS